MTSERRLDLTDEGVGTVEIILDKALMRFGATSSRDELLREVRTVLIGCPFAHLMVGPNGREIIDDGRRLADFVA